MVKLRQTVAVKRWDLCLSERIASGLVGLTCRDKETA